LIGLGLFARLPARQLDSYWERYASRSQVAREQRARPTLEAALIEVLELIPLIAVEVVVEVTRVDPAGSEDGRQVGVAGVFEEIENGLLIVITSEAGLHLLDEKDHAPGRENDRTVPPFPQVNDRAGLVVAIDLILDPVSRVQAGEIRMQLLSTEGPAAE
jgi:hypothetical protein